MPSMPNESMVIARQVMPTTLMLEGVHHMNKKKAPQHLTPGHHGSQQKKASSAGGNILKGTGEGELEQVPGQELNLGTEHIMLHRIHLVRKPA
eukprot:12921122-Prorocentrum_lima.AAC.1